MNRSAALDQLPEAYAVALRLDDAGTDQRLIARALQVPIESIPWLLEIGRSKLEVLLNHTRGGEEAEAATNG